MTATATQLMKLDWHHPGQDARVFRLDPPLSRFDDTVEETVIIDTVVVSAIREAFDTGLPETYIFPADEEGNVVDWGELPGSARNVHDVEGVLNKLGYTVVKDSE